MNPVDIIKEFYTAGSTGYDILVRHGEQVAQKALDIIENRSDIRIDRQFVLDAAMLHDIGICKTRSTAIGCSGTLPYICHGVQGRNMLDGIGLSKLALVCERHVGVGIRSSDIIDFHLPLPVRDMVPVTIEEKLVCYADKFFSKKSSNGKEKSPERIVAGLRNYGEDQVKRFYQLRHLFESKKM